MREHKLNSIELFNSGVTEFRKGLFLSAQRAFNRVTALNPSDSVAAHFRDSCTLSVMHKQSAEWDGAEKIELK